MYKINGVYLHFIITSNKTTVKNTCISFWFTVNVGVSMIKKIHILIVTLSDYQKLVELIQYSMMRPRISTKNQLIFYYELCYE